MTLQQQIRAELLRTRNDNEAFAWLSSPQDILKGRIPARMIAIGEAEEVLHALQANHPTTTTKEPT